MLGIHQGLLCSVLQLQYQHPLELTKLGVGKHNQRGSASTISGVELKKKDFKNKHFIILSNVFIIVLMYKIFIRSGMNHVQYEWLT